MKLIQMLTALLLSLLFVACEFEHEQNGYPKRYTSAPMLKHSATKEMNFWQDSLWKKVIKP